MKRGHKQFDAREYPRAYANFDWAIVGRHDPIEAAARVFSATSLWQSDRREEAEEVWAQAYGFDPVALLFRAKLAEHLERDLGDDDPVPGTEPTDIDEVQRLHPELFEQAADDVRSLPSA